MVNSVNAASLPFPVSAPRGRYHTAGTSPFHRSRSGDRLSFLVSRARTTNLAVLILAAVSVLSVLINIRLYLGDAVFRKNGINSLPVPLSIFATLHPPSTPLHHLIMVPGHAIWTGQDPGLVTNDGEWILEEYQKGGSVKTFVKHIDKGVELAVMDPRSLLIYSGGQTRAHADISEGAGYARLARAGNLYNYHASLPGGAVDSDEATHFERVTTEDFALDSYENLLFAIARFKEFAGHYPTFITVVGFGIKQRRYEEVHRVALRWPLTAFKYIGIDNEQEKDIDYEGERISGLEPFVRESYGCKGALLAKRKKRNPFRRFHPYHSSAPELRGLMEHCPKSNEMFDGPLPWDT